MYSVLLWDNNHSLTNGGCVISGLLAHNNTENIDQHVIVTIMTIMKCHNDHPKQFCMNACLWGVMHPQAYHTAHFEYRFGRVEEEARLVRTTHLMDY